MAFVEYWKRQEVDLGVRWGVKGVSAIQEKRREFKHEKEIKDPITGETVQIFPTMQRLQRQLLQIPFAILASLALGSLIATCFGIEIFISEIYNGPGKSILVFLPTGLLTTLIPTLTTLLTGVATRLTDYENYETTESYEAAMTEKIFVLNFITSYLPIFLTAFVYVPFGSLIVPSLDIFKLTMRPFAQREKQLEVPKAGFEINPSRLRKQVIYFTVTAQIVGLAMEVIVPWAKRQGFVKYQEMKSERAAKRGGAKPSVTINDLPEEAAFLTKVRNEAELDLYDVTTDLREMCLQVSPPCSTILTPPPHPNPTPPLTNLPLSPTQFGYLALFSVIWPLVPVSFLINNWIELRSDALKICIEMQRPTPHRADSIGPWLDNLSFLTWLGTLTTSALVYLFRNDGLGPDGSPATIHGWALLLTIFFAEHVYFLLRIALRAAVAKIDSPGMRTERAERFAVRKSFLQETLGEEALVRPPRHREQQITRASLEEEARASTLRSYGGAEEMFWGRQRSWEESAMVGTGLIQRMVGDEEGKKRL